jgi:hypothetical protein
MFSSQPRVRDDGEILSPCETFSWQEDDTVTRRRRRRERRNRAWVAIIGVVLVVLVCREALANSGFLSALAQGKW